MYGEQRREKIIDILNSISKPVSGVALASLLKVSRQVIVQDIALIRASDNEISSTNRGYVIRKKNEHTRIFKVVHTEADVEAELNSIVDMVAGLKMCSYITKYTELLRQILICTQGVILMIIWQRLEMESLIC